jgi:hypothetical protein
MGGPQLPDVGNCGSAENASPAIPITVADIALWRHLHEAASAAREAARKDAAQALSKSQTPNSTEVRLEHRALQLIAEGCTMPVTPFDLELMEIARTEGNSAMLKRIRQHEIDERRQKTRRKTLATRARLAGEAQARTAANLAAQLLNEQRSRELANVPTPSPQPPAEESLLIKKKPPQPETTSARPEDRLNQAMKNVV